ncbi:caspase, EACC1-associated type [Micromonospora carbonacea]|uniref:caspase, EACC1-associated type n=1 Tax=Micromonospora carbonacea TaxID=47853 RepID=UPI00371ACCBC
MTALSNAGARVLLIATAEHPEGSTLPSVSSIARSFEDLQNVLLERCGVDLDRLRAVLNPSDAETMAQVIAEEAQRAETVLMIYFIGHGLLDHDGELYLAAKSTDRLVPGLAGYQALSFSALRQAVRASRASSVVVVLDCCFSGKVSLGSGKPVPALTVAPAHGMYLIGSAEQLALAPPNAKHTAFTGSLIALLTHGDPRGPHLLTLDAAYDAVFRAMRDQQRPLPRRQAGDRSGSLVIAPNRAVPAQPQSPQDEPQHSGRCPYPGLEAFGVDDADVFHGRERMTSRLLAAVAASADQPGLLVLVGPSGSGKTSLLNAGLLDGLRHDGLPGLPGSAGWPVVRFTPGTTPLSRLATQLGAATPDAADLLRENPDSIVDLIADLLADRPNARLLVLVDQLEELFTLCPNPTERTAFLQALTAVATPAGDHPPVGLVVLALRADFYGQAAEHHGLLTALRDRQLLVEPMTSEELHAAIEQPAATAGLVLDDGLVDLILLELGAATNGQSPVGVLPLLSHVLWATWRQRTGSRLTAAGYRASGGISQAIATTADRVYNDLDVPGQEAMRRILPQLVRVGEDRVDTAQPVDRTLLMQIVPDVRVAQQVIDRLTEARLLTLDRDTARISHEALLHAWRQLREWVDADRDWLRARQQLADDAQAWERSGRDPSQLYRGNRLAAMRELLAPAPTGSSELEPVSAEFMDNAGRHERRVVRRRRLAVALLVVLSLSASGLAVWAATANHEAQRQLRLAHSRALAEDAMRFRKIDPRAALQLAQAAWHTAPTSEAYGALLTQYAGLRSVEKVFQNVWQGNLSRIMTSPDGSIAATVNDGGLPSVWAGLNGDDPRQGVAGPAPHRLTGGTFQLSPSGKLWAYDNGAGSVALWDLEHHSPAVMLRDTAAPARTVRSIAFSPDETRLLIKRAGYGTRSPEYELWDLVQRKTIPIAKHLGSQKSNTNPAFLGLTPNTMVEGEFFGSAHVYDLTTGQEIRSIPRDDDSPRVAQNGAVVLQCHRESGEPVRGILRVIDPATGAAQRTIPVPGCFFELDTSTNYALFEESDDTGTIDKITIVALDTGEIYQAIIPPLSLPNQGRGYKENIAVFASDDGHPVMLIGDKNLLYRQRPTKPDQRTGKPGATDLISPQGNLAVSFDRAGMIKLNDLRSGATLATTSHGPLCWGVCAPGRPLAFTPDGKRLLAIADDTLVIYSVPALTVKARSELPLPSELGGPPTDDGEDYWGWGSSIASLKDNQVTILHAGMITRWNPTDGTPIGTPTQVRTDRDGLRRSAHTAVLRPRPHHPEHALVTQPSGDVELWNLDQHQIIAHLGRAEPSQGSVPFTPDGSVAGLHTPDGNIQLWNVDAGLKRGRPIPSDGGLLGFTPDGKLIVVKDTHSLFGTAEIWDQNSGKRLADLTWPAVDPNWMLEGSRLTLLSSDEALTFELDPKLWFDALCKHNSRDFTDDERAILTELGASDERPCG